jgi:hypothetical protein
LQANIAPREQSVLYVTQMPASRVFEQKKPQSNPS